MGASSALRLSLLLAVAASSAAGEPPYVAWLSRFGHDDFVYPAFIREQMESCTFTVDPVTSAATFYSAGALVDWRAAADADAALDYCTAKSWLVDHMPAFDLNYLPPSVSINVTSMLDDVAAFAVMADGLNNFNVTLSQKLAYVLPYASYHEARTNWRPLLFAKHVAFTFGAATTAEAMARLVAPNVFTNWTGNMWEGAPRAPTEEGYTIEWQSSTAPPVVAPADFVLNGYSSCSGWATMVTYIARSLGIPARQAGTPCWNGGDFVGLVSENPNVTACWAGGNGQTQGGGYLWNHNWVEFFDDVTGEWAFINVPPSSSVPNSGLCSSYSSDHGCNYDTETESCPAPGASNPGTASQDHEIFAITWSFPDEHSDPSFDGGEVIDVADLTLSDGTPVSPMVWAPQLASPLGQPLKNVGLRVVNRTESYRCKL